MKLIAKREAEPIFREYTRRGIQDFDHPVTSMIPAVIVDHKPGSHHFPSPDPQSAKRNENVTSFLPPKTTHEIPKQTVARRILLLLANTTGLNPQPLPPGEESGGKSSS